MECFGPGVFFDCVAVTTAGPRFTQAVYIYISQGGPRPQWDCMWDTTVKRQGRGDGQGTNPTQENSKLFKYKLPSRYKMIKLSTYDLPKNFNDWTLVFGTDYTKLDECV